MEGNGAARAVTTQLGSMSGATDRLNGTRWLGPSHMIKSANEISLSLYKCSTTYPTTEICSMDFSPLHHLTKHMQETHIALQGGFRR
jgi:hypothetical protein